MSNTLCIYVSWYLASPCPPPSQNLSAIYSLLLLLFQCLLLLPLSISWIAIFPSLLLFIALSLFVCFLFVCFFYQRLHHSLSISPRSFLYHSTCICCHLSLSPQGWLCPPLPRYVSLSLSLSLSEFYTFSHDFLSLFLCAFL